MRRRELMIGMAAIALAPRAALARDRSPKLEIRVVARVEHRREPVDRKGVVLRFVLYGSLMDRNPTWEETKTVKITDGHLETTLSRDLGTVEGNGFGETMVLGIFVKEMGPAVTDVKLSPRVELDWRGSGTAPCLEQNESLAQGDLDLGGSCTMTGEGAVAFYITTLQRVPTEAQWQEEKAAKENR